MCENISRSLTHFLLHSSRIFPLWVLCFLVLFLAKEVLCFLWTRFFLFGILFFFVFFWFLPFCSFFFWVWRVFPCFCFRDYKTFVRSLGHLGMFFGHFRTTSMLPTIFRSFGAPLMAIQACGFAKRCREDDDVVAVVSSKHTIATGFNLLQDKWHPTPNSGV